MSEEEKKAQEKAEETLQQEEQQEQQDDTVKISRKKLDKLLNRVERLEQSADKGRLARYDSLSQEGKQKAVNLKTLDGRVIKKVETVENRVDQNIHTGTFTENQVVKVTFEDNRTQNMEYIYFARNYSLIPAVVKREIYDSEEGLIFEVETDEGKTYKINEKYVN